MNQTIVGVFDTQASAMQARQELLSAGFAQSEVTTLPAEGSATGTTSAASTASSATPAHAGGVSGFFKSLFGMDERDEHVGLYSTAVQQGGFMVSVNTHNDAQLQQAEQILQRCGAIDIDERAAQWFYGVRVLWSSETTPSVGQKPVRVPLMTCHANQVLSIMHAAVEIFKSRRRRTHSQAAIHFARRTPRRKRTQRHGMLGGLRN